jgi:hypothetical protein
MAMKLIVWDSSGERLDRFRNAIGNCEAIGLHHHTSDGVSWKAINADAMFISIFSAEEYGAKPLIETIQVLPTSDADRAKGLPPFAITDIATRPGEPISDREVTELGLDKLVSTVESHPDIETVAVGLLYLMGFDRLSIEELADIVLKVFRRYGLC